VIQCPGPQAIDLVDTLSRQVSYPAPQVFGGTAPVSVSCSVPDGASLGPGATNVTCTASDARAQTGQCSFSIVLTLVARLKGTRIVAFGDSMTAGEVAPPFETNIRVLEPQNSYPTVLGRLLAERYRAQTVTVINEGVPGERVLGTGGSGESGEDRMETVVQRHRPDVLLVLEGVNGLLTVADAVPISEGLRRGVRRAVRDGVRLVIVSTILPGVAEGTKPPNSAAVTALNNEIRSWVGREGAVLADSYVVFDPMRTSLIGKDGLHPTVDGYRRLAEIFFDLIKNHFEEPPPMAPARLLGAPTTRPLMP
jgi:lysophospholipase L1-like esterase